MPMNYSLNHSKFLSPDELSHFEHILQKFRFTNLRDVTLLRTALETGARAQELLNINPEDLDVRRRRVFIRGLKKSNDRYVPLHKDLFDDIYHMTEGGSRPPFRISYQHFRRIWFNYRPVKKKLHSLRHTHAITLYRQTQDLLLVKSRLGHRSIGNTMIYLDFAVEEGQRPVLFKRAPTPSRGTLSR